MFREISKMTTKQSDTLFNLYYYCRFETRFKKECCLIRQENTMYIFYQIMFFKYRTRQLKATETNKLLILIEMTSTKMM